MTFIDRLYGNDTYIFGFDGTFIDNEPLLMSLYDEFLKKHGFNRERWDIHDRDSIINMGEAPFTKRELHRWINKRLVETIEEKGIRPNGYVWDVLGRCKGRFGIVTRQNKPTIEKILSIWGLDAVFDPGLMLMGVKEKEKAYRKIRKANKESGIVLFEDDEECINYAKELGFYTVGVKNSINKEINADTTITGKEAPKLPKKTVTEAHKKAWD